MKATQPSTIQRLYDCPVCDLQTAPEPTPRFTREELPAHLTDRHPGWALCKGCDELMTPRENEEGKGWCGLCVSLCYDCMDREKYPDDDL